MQESRASQVFWMLLSAGVFAYFGFYMQWTHRYDATTTPPRLIPMVVLLMWTLRGGAIAFVLSAAVLAAARVPGVLLGAVVGILASVIFIIVGVWEMTNSSGYFSGIPAILLFVVAAFEGFFSVGAVFSVLDRGRPISSTHDYTASPDDYR